MGFFSNGTFWFVEGILLCLAVFGFKTWADDRGIRLNIWKWLLLGLWLLFFGFTITFVGTSLGENETTAALKGGIIFGLVAIISGVGLWRLIVSKKS